MDTVEKERVKPIDELIEKVTYLRYLHEDICATEHALYERNHCYIPYEPTFFLYNFFCFNIIFNIDWEASIGKGEVVESNGNEKKQYTKLINFCFLSNTQFVKVFLPVYRRIVTFKYDTHSILKAIKDIIIDNVNIEAADKGSFQASCAKVLQEESANVEDIKAIYTFIYKVRCNIVHGTKTMNDMSDIEQRIRITTYSYMIVALMHMLFMRLEYERHGFYNPSMSTHFLEQMSKRFDNLNFKAEDKE
jgi:hypothetical protein